MTNRAAIAPPEPQKSVRTRRPADRRGKCGGNARQSRRGACTLRRGHGRRARPCQSMAQSRHCPGAEVGTAQGDRGLRSRAGAGAGQCAGALQPWSRAQRRRQCQACRIVAARCDQASAHLSRRVCRAGRRTGTPGQERRSHRCADRSAKASTRASGLPAQPGTSAAEIRQARRGRGRVANRVRESMPLSAPPGTHWQACCATRASQPKPANCWNRYCRTIPHTSRHRARCCLRSCSGTTCRRKQFSRSRKRSAPAFSAACPIRSPPSPTCDRHRES